MALLGALDVIQNGRQNGAPSWISLKVKMLSGKRGNCKYFASVVNYDTIKQFTPFW